MRAGNGVCPPPEKAGFPLEESAKSSAVKNSKMPDMKPHASTWDTAPYTVRRLTPEHLAEACGLIWEVFQRFEAPEYAPEGIAEFRSFLSDKDALGRMVFYGAFREELLMGVLAVRNLHHISLFFVKEEYHRQGVGKALFETMRRDHAGQCITVNASPDAVEIYRRLGFLGLSQILCKHRNAVQIEQNLFKAEVAQAAAALFSK